MRDSVHYKHDSALQCLEQLRKQLDQSRELCEQPDTHAERV